MLRALGLAVAWFGALLHDNQPVPRECFCNCTCSIEHKTVGDHTSWRWELTKGLACGVIGSIITFGWRLIVRVGLLALDWLSSSQHRRPELGPIAVAEIKSSLEEVREEQREVTTRAQEQLAALRQRQALRHTHGSR